MKRVAPFALALGIVGGSSGAVRHATGSGGSSATGSSVTTSSATGGSTSAGFRVALSVSPFTGALFANGASFSDGKSVAADAASLEAMFIAHGGNEVYARVSTEKAKGTTADDHSEATALVLASLAKARGLPFNPELGLWAHYGDITCEPPPDFSAYPSVQLPGAWNTLDDDQMATAIQAYATLVATDVLATGATVDVWDIGNEVDFGTAGVAPQGINCATPYVAPDGVDPAIGSMSITTLLQDDDATRIAWLSAHVWPHEAKLLGAARNGILAVDANARFETHMSQSSSATFAVGFYQAMIDGGFSPDTLGFSYYPSSNATPGRAAAFKNTVSTVHAMFGKPVFLAEFAYPAGPTPARV